MRRSQRQVSYEVRRGRLVRHVRLPDGRGYTHHCTRATFEEVAAVIDERGEAGVTTNELWEALPEMSCTQAALALVFLKERGVVEVEGRRCYPAGRTPFEDALIEFHALAEPPEGDEPRVA